MILYIIGNGFDLHHGLKTSYFDFALYLKKHNPDLYYTLEKYIAFPVSDKSLWSRFESNLANLDVDEILTEHNGTLPNYGSDDFRDRDRYVFPDLMEEYYNKLTTGLLNEFRNFILSVDFLNSYEYKLDIDKSARFLTFNYTGTLEKLYNIPQGQILYIHNPASARYDNIILGHGIDPANFEEKRLIHPDGLNEEEIERWYEEHDDYDYSYNTGKESIMKYFQTSYKPTKEIIKRNYLFFESLSTISELVVLGHSISEVDLPYFEQIVNSVSKECKWHVSFYNNLEKIRHLETLKKLGIDERNIRQIELLDIQEYNKQLKFDF